MIPKNPFASFVEQFDSVSGKKEYKDCEKYDVDVNQEKDEKVSALGVQLPHGFVSAPEKEDQANEKKDNDNGGQSASVIPEFERKHLHSHFS
jgi:hypothetical protein